tara:strand:+ start:649 stop:1296 length:648 start_codon:yes stop_codon:yes gene_type:complete
MASIILKPKTASFGVLANLPLADVSTTCVAVAPAFYTAAIPAMSPAVALGQYIIVKISLQNAVGAASRTVRIIKANGDVLLTFPTVAQPALPLLATIIYTTRAFISNPADWVGVLVQVSSGTAGDAVVIKANTLVFGFAEFCNIADDRYIKRNVENIYFMTMQTAQEGILGKEDVDVGTTFSVVAVNGLVSGFVWSSNSGNTLYSWNGTSIGIGG